ncbi:MAG TPA: hypothetical protein VIG72_05185 [Pontibacter sp.]
MQLATMTPKLHHIQSTSTIRNTAETELQAVKLTILSAPASS